MSSQLGLGMLPKTFARSLALSTTGFVFFRGLLMFSSSLAYIPFALQAETSSEISFNFMT
jgi:hypothetical protein